MLQRDREKGVKYLLRCVKTIKYRRPGGYLTCAGGNCPLLAGIRVSGLSANLVYAPARPILARARWGPGNALLHIGGYPQPFQRSPLLA